MILEIGVGAKVTLINIVMLLSFQESKDETKGHMLLKHQDLNMFLKLNMLIP
jgi:hypothetical protein